MTTSSGKPPVDELAIDSSWGSEDAVEPESAGFEVAKAGGSGDEDPAVYGVGVPYGGNDRTEEVEPIALDMPFSPDSEVLTPPVVTPALNTPRRPVQARVPSAARDSELKAPVAQLVLSDLFDSTPPPPGSSMEPPDPAAFSTSRPPPGRGLQGLRRGKAQEESPPAAATPWAVSPQSTDSKYFSTGPTPSARASSPPRPYPAGAPTSSGFPSDAPAQAPASAFVRGAEPITSGGVVALPSINVLAESSSPAQARLERARPSAQPSAPSRTPLEEAVLVEAESIPPPAPPAALTGLASPGHGPLVESAPVETEPPLEAERAEVEPASLEAASLEAASFNAAEAASLEAAEAASLEAAEATPEQPTAVAAAAASAPAAGQRRNVDTLESVGNAATRPKRNGPSRAGAWPADELGRFPSQVPTSRPPDVLHADSEPPAQASERPSGPGSRSRSSAAPGARRSSNPPQSVLAALPSTKTGQIALPSVMLGADVEAEPDGASVRRAQRAARATVRIELPEGFGRPGSPLLQGLSTRGPSTALPQFESRRGVAAAKRWLPWLIGGLVVLALCLAFVFRPRSGSLVVTALGAGHRAVESVQIFVDGDALCDSSPCRISGLTAGNHRLRASAPGLSSGAEQVVEITAGQEAAANIELSSLEPEARAGGLRVAAGDKELTLYVDNRRVGKLPQSVSGLAIGKHWIKLDAEDGSPPIEKAVNVTSGEVLDVDPRPGKRDKVTVTIRINAESEGASVTFDDAFLLDFPAELELDPHSKHTLSATKPGYEDFNLQLELGEETEKQVEVALTPAEGGAHRARLRPSATAGLAPAVRKPAAVSKPVTAPVVDPTQGLLNISSVPPSQIILNGRPLGSTPKTAVVVPGDSLQTIVFVHPKMGRRRAQKFVPAGKERTVSIRF